MLITHEREKLIEVIKFFSKNTKYCGLVKVFKLLYFLDFESFRQTGRSVTGLIYHALPKGPVPDALYRTIKDDKKIGDINVVGFSSVETEDGKSKNIPSKFEFKTRFDSRFFTKREIRIMERLAEIYLDATADMMSEVSHSRGGPWANTIKQGTGTPIDYMLSLSAEDDEKLSREEIAEIMADNDRARRVFL